MSKKWLLIPILLIFIFAISITGLAQYKYTQQSGTGYFVSEADKSDALEDTNELRMILDELGLLLEHSKYGDASYPADENTTPGTLDVFDDYLQNITSESIGDLSDVDTTGVADNKILKYDIATSKWIIADDEDTGTTYTAGTGLDLTGTVFSLDASVFDLSDFPADPNDDRYLFWNDTTGALTWAEGSGSGVTTFVGLTDTPLAYTGYAGYFPKVNAGETALEFAELTESDISDLGTYLTSETDPVFTASDVYSVTTADISNWNTAYDWGDWSGEGFITGVAWGDITGTLSNQSDLNTALGNKLANVSEDTTPELGGELDAGANSIGFTLQTVAEADGTTTIDWKNGNHCKVTLGAQNETFTFTAPSNPCTLTLIIIQDATGGRDITWPASVKWLGTEATWTDGGAGKGIVVGFIYDGTNYWGQATPWES